MRRAEPSPWRSRHERDEGPSCHDHDHSHGLVHDSIKRSREGVRAVLVSLAVLGLAAIAQTLVFVLSGSVALLADLIHNFGDALTAVPLSIAFLLRSERAERSAGLAVVAAIFVSACVAGAEAVSRLVHPSAPGHLVALAAAGAVADRHDHGGGDHGQRHVRVGACVMSWATVRGRPSIPSHPHPG